MAPARSARRPRFTLALLILTSITLLSLDHSGVGPLDSARRAVLSVTSPVRGFVGDVLSPVGGLWTRATSSGDLAKENERLRAEVEELRGELAREDSAAATLEQLLDEVDIPYVSSLDTVTARVVGGPVANTGASLEIDKGSAAGIREGMAVISSGGLVGSVDVAAPRRSTIRLITDAGYRVGVRVDETLLGICVGQGAGELLRVELSVDASNPVLEDMVITTSGLERSLFPPGIPIGRVTSVSIAEDGLTQFALVEPLADLEAAGFLNAVLWVPPT